MALGRSKAIIAASSPSKLATTNGKRELCTTLETISATGQIILPFIIWANKIHAAIFYGHGGIYIEDATFATSPSGYMDNELTLWTILTSIPACQLNYH